MPNLPSDLAAIRARLDDARDWVALSKKENGLKIIEKGTLVFNLEKTLREHECLLARLEEMREALERLKGWIEHGLPEVPHEGSHTPESGCDINCMNEAQLSNDMGLATSALTRPLDMPG